jgi:hypothetical protein
MDRRSAATKAAAAADDGLTTPATTTGTIIFVPDDPSQASFSGHLAESDSRHTNPRNAIESKCRERRRLRL